MVMFLSNEWLAEMDALLRAADAPPDIPSVTIEQHIEAEPGTEPFIYQVIVGPQRCWASPGSGTRPTVTYRQSRATAIAIATETRTAHEAFMLGDLIVDGDATALTEALPAMAWLGETLTELQQRTEFS